MNASSLIRLIVLSAIWGASFLFMRVSVPSLGPMALIMARVALAAVFLLMVALLLKKTLPYKEHYKHFLILGFFNTAFPFLLLAYAAQTLTVSMLSILNATAPIWGVITTSLWFKTSLSKKTILGLLLGVLGVYTLMSAGKTAGGNAFNMQMLPSILASLLAAFSYGCSSTYTQVAKKVEPFANAHGSMWAATFLFLPFVIFYPIHTAPTVTVVWSVLLLGIVCSGIAYLLYFRLIIDIGAGPALTVTYLVPLFGILWGYLFLEESIGFNTIIGAGIIFMGTALVTKTSLNLNGFKMLRSPRDKN